MAQLKECSVNGCTLPSRANAYCNKHNLRFKKYGDPLGGIRNQAPLEERFWRYVEKSDGCWRWTGNHTATGYGQIQSGGKGSPKVGAHRLSYEIHHGPIPDGMVIMHSCDNPPCVNPAHLSVGTYKQNTADMASKGRRRGRIILTLEQVAQIRASSEPARVFAPIYGVSKSAIWAVRTGQNWKDVK